MKASLINIRQVTLKPSPRQRVNATTQFFSEIAKKTGDRSMTLNWVSECVIGLVLLTPDWSISHNATDWGRGYLEPPSPISDTTDPIFKI